MIRSFWRIPIEGPADCFVRSGAHVATSTLLCDAALCTVTGHRNKQPLKTNDSFILANSDRRTGGLLRKERSPRCDVDVALRCSPLHSHRTQKQATLKTQ